MRITIGDLDYYHTAVKHNCFNVDAMRISSYHKQMGDQVNFVRTQYDIYRPYDIYYIIKEKRKTPNPPFEFFTNSKVRFLGQAYRIRAGKMPDIMLAVRPDYLLYPEKNTREEKSEMIQLFNSQSKLLPRIQDYSNTFKGKKRVILTDKYIGFADKKSLIQAFQILAEVKNLSFSEPIWIQKLYNDKELKDEFLKLKLTPGAHLNWLTVDADEFDIAFNFLLEVQKTGPDVSIGSLEIKIKKIHHWTSWLNAYRDFNQIKEKILRGKKEGIQIKIAPLGQRLDTPYFLLFEEISKGTHGPRGNLSGLEYLMGEYKMYGQLNKPHTGNEVFRDLLRQTYQDKEFLLLRRKNNYMNENDIPGNLGEEEFKYGI